MHKNSVIKDIFSPIIYGVPVFILDGHILGMLELEYHSHKRSLKVVTRTYVTNPLIPLMLLVYSSSSL